ARPNEGTWVEVCVVECLRLAANNIANAQERRASVLAKLRRFERKTIENCGDFFQTHSRPRWGGTEESVAVFGDDIVDVCCEAHAAKMRLSSYMTGQREAGGFMTSCRSPAAVL